MAEKNEFTNYKKGSSGDWMPEEVICPGGCEDIYHDARILPCLHSFCRKCLQKQLEKTGGDSDQAIKCRVCGKSTSLPKRGIDGLSQNLRLQFRSESVGYALILEKGATCDECIEDAPAAIAPSNELPTKNKGTTDTKASAIASRQAVTFCCECHKFFCQACTDYHKRNRSTYKHPLVDTSKKGPGAKAAAKMEILKKIRSLREYPCTEPRHEKNVLGFYCEDCDKLVCQACVCGKHKDHDYKELTEVATKHKEEMDALLGPAKEATNMLELAIGNSEKMMKNVAATKDRVRKKITEEFDRMEQAIKRRRTQMLNTTDNIAAVKRTRLDLQRGEFRVMKDEIEMYQRTIEEAKEFTEEEIVAYKRFLQIELDAILKRFNALRLQVNESDAMPMALDAQPLADQISGFGVVTSGCSPLHSVVGLHLPTAIKGKERKIVVRACDENGKPFVYGSEDVVAELQLVGSTGPPILAGTHDNEDGTYTLLFVPQSTGQHKLAVTIRNQPVLWSPFDLWVREPRDYAALETTVQQTIDKMGGNYVYYVAIHENGDLYVSQNDYIRVVNPADGSTKGTIGAAGKGDGQFGYPAAIALQGDYVYVADYNNDRIQKLSATGKYDYLNQFGKKGTGDGEFTNPRGICLDLQGKIFVADYNAHRVQVFNADTTFAYKIPADDTKLNAPWGLAFDADGKLHIACYGTKTVRVYSNDGRFETEYGKEHLIYPAGIAVSAEGYSFVTEFNGSNSRLQIFGPPPERALVKSIPGLKNSEGVALTKDGFIYVGDRENSRVLKY